MFCILFELVMLKEWKSFKWRNGFKKNIKKISLIGEKKGVFKLIFFMVKFDLGKELFNELSSYCGVKKRKKILFWFFISRFKIIIIYSGWLWIFIYCIYY